MNSEGLRTLWFLLFIISPHPTICSLLPHLPYAFLQDSFPTDTNQEPAVSLTPHPTLPAPEKELKGVKFSEVAVILDAEPGDDDPGDDDSEGNESAADDVSL